MFSFLCSTGFRFPHLYLPSLSAPSVLRSPPCPRHEQVTASGALVPQSLNLPIHNQRDKVTSENPESEGGGMEWVPEARPLLPNINL